MARNWEQQVVVSSGHCEHSSYESLSAKNKLFQQDLVHSFHWIRSYHSAYDHAYGSSYCLMAVAGAAGAAAAGGAGALSEEYLRRWKGVRTGRDLNRLLVSVGT